MLVWHVGGNMIMFIASLGVKKLGEIEVLVECKFLDR